MDKEIHLGIYMSDDPHQMRENINAQIQGGRSLGSMNTPCNYDFFGYVVMREVSDDDHSGLECITLHPGNYTGIGPAIPVRDRRILNAILGGMRRCGLDSRIDIQVADNQVIDLSP
jgi:hypothetical protein